MDTNRLKKFAVDARNKIKAGVEAKLSTLGFDSQGNVPDFMKPQLMQGGSLWNGQLMTESFYHQWMALYDAVKKHGAHHIYEEAAYTWFNRLVAIRILQKNGIIEPVLTYVDEARTPKIVDDARSAGRIPPMTEADRQRLMELLDDDTKMTEQFAILISAYCHANPIIRQSFGRMADYTELLLPNNILAENGFIDDLNHTEFITDEDYKSSELIGWLYQFYISERKDEVFAKKGKYDADEIAPATQIFTPHWIVEYMVQNTIGRIYLDNHPDDADILKPKWKYLVDQEPTNEARADVQARLDSALQGGGSQRQQRDDEHIYHFDELTELRCADLGCGSGHILGYMFDILFDLYIYEGYTRKEAVENILSHNITGVDIDLRAKQLATFALLLKACQKDESFRDGNVLPNVLTMPEPIADSDRHQLFHEFFKGEETNNILTELDDAFDLLKDAQTLGSIMKFNLSKSTLLAIRQTMNYWKGQSFVPDSVTTLLPSFRLILALTEKYTALVMNPPYMGSGRFDNVLSKYVKDNYPTGKADLFAVFMLVAKDRLVPSGMYAMINMQSWMFLSSFELLRKCLIENAQIESMLHLGPHTFDELGGEVVQNVAFVVCNQQPSNVGTYYRLINGRNCKEKERMFLANLTSNHNTDEHIFFSNIKQNDFEKIPESPIDYWISESVAEAFENPLLNTIAPVRKGLDTGNNDYFLKLWHEVNFKEIGIRQTKESFVKAGFTWAPHDKGGHFSRWYGNNDWVILWNNNGEELRKSSANLRSEQYYFLDAITWNSLSSGKICFRYSNYGAISNTAGSSLYPSSNIFYLLGALNTLVIQKCIDILSPTLNYSAGPVGLLPIKYNDGVKVQVERCVQQNVSLSKLDWDAHETSWDFQENPLVEIMKEATRPASQTDGLKSQNQWLEAAKTMVSGHENDDIASENYCEQGEAGNDKATVMPLPGGGNDVTKPWYDDYHTAVTELEDMLHPADCITTHGSTLELCINAFEKLWTARFMQLHANEEELNRQFIDIYGMQDELTPDVPLNEITILQQGEITIE